MATEYWGTPELLTVSASPTPTSTQFTVSSAGNLLVKQYILVKVSGAFQRAQITAIAGNALTVAGLTGTPDTPGEVRNGRQLIKNATLNAGAVLNAASATDLKTVNTTYAPAGLKYLLTDTARLYRFDPTSSATGNDVTVIAPTTGPGRWLLVNLGGGGGLGGKLLLVDPSHPSATDASNGSLPFATFTAGLDAAANITGAVLQVAPGDYTSEDPGTSIWVSVNHSKLTIEGLGDRAALAQGAGVVLLPDIGFQGASGTQVVIRNLTCSAVHLFRTTGSNGNVLIEGVRFTGASGVSENGDALNGEALSFEDAGVTNGDRSAMTVRLRNCSLPAAPIWWAYADPNSLFPVGPQNQNATIALEECTFASGCSMPADTSAPAFAYEVRGGRFLGAHTVGTGIGDYLFVYPDYTAAELRGRVTFGTDLTFNRCLFRAGSSVLEFANNSLNNTVRVNACDLRADYGTSASNVVSKAGGSGTKVFQNAGSIASGIARTVQSGITNTTVTTAFI